MNSIRRFSVFLVSILGLLILWPLQTLKSQNRQQGPFWPNAEWGAEDQAGASNHITPEKILEALKLVSAGQTYELGQVYEQGMPLYPGRSYSMILPSKDGAGGENRIVGNDEFLATQIGQVGTQFDGLGHIGQEVTMENGQVEFVFYNGFTASEMDSYTGLKKLGVEHVKPIITRGILIDIASYKNVERLDNSYEVTVADVQGALKKQGLSEADIKPGDAVLFRYGWSSLWDKPDEYNLNPPGIGMAVAKWAAEKKVTMVGSDSWCTEVIPNPLPGQAFPIHQELMMRNGIFNLENMQLDGLAEDNVNEFLFIMTPIRFKGATGSPARPIAIR